MQAELLDNQSRSTPKAPLFHYTGEAALRGILEHRRPWCFSHSQQSDDTEVRYSFEIAQRVIRDEIERGHPAVKSILTGLVDILATNPMGETFDFYFFSLSSHLTVAETGMASLGELGQDAAVPRPLPTHVRSQRRGTEGEHHIRLEPRFVDRLRALRAPGARAPHYKNDPVQPAS